MYTNMHLNVEGKLPVVTNSYTVHLEMKQLCLRFKVICRVQFVL